MLQVKRFSGVLNTDDFEADILPPQHIGAKNTRFYGGANGLTATNIKGTTLIANSNLPAGTNECIGSFFDQVKQRIIWFNYNSNGNHGIYQVLIQTGSVNQIFRCGINSATDILTFSLDYPVHSAVIVYRTEGDGDLLYWTDGYNRPGYLNLDTVAALSPLTSDMVTAAKQPPLSPPVPIYQDDVTTNVNNLQKKLFRFIYRWTYKNGEKSTWSPISKVPLPVGGYSPTTQNDPTKNNNIKIPVVGGGKDYQTIEIGGQINLNNVWGDFFLIDSLDRTDYVIAPGATYNYYFYNNASYTSIAVDETDLYFDWMPDKANTLELLNGNVIIYGGITEGYDKITRQNINVIITTALGTPNVPTISFAYSGANVFTMQIGPVLTAGAVYNVQFDYFSSSPGDASPKNINYITPFGPSVAAVASGIAALLTGNNIAVDNLGSGMLRVRVSPVGVGSTITNVQMSVLVAGTEIAAASWKWSAPYRFGLVYFDDRGKTNGVVSFVSDSSVDVTDFSVTTPAFNVNVNVPQIPIISASINHTPPTWATTYQWVRANLLPTKFLYWITSDYQTDANYLYLCIQNLTYQGTELSGFVPSYEFAEGDRIRVIAAYTAGNYIPYNIQLDMEVLGTVERTMNTPAILGTFIKVGKPTTIPSAAYQTAMFVEIYTPSTIASDKKQLFYEWGEKYNIYTSGANRYHRGQINDQTAGQPATFEWFDGDVYYKGRQFYTVVNSATTATEFTIDANYNDFFQSAVNSNGRGWVIDENAQEQYNPVLVRWGGKYQSGTNLNALNRFRPNDFDEVDRAKGDIQRFKTRDRILRVFQDRGVGQYGVYARFIQNNAGVPELVTTNEIITTNNINYYQGTFGLGGYPTNLCSSPIADYFNDVVTGREIRLSYDGMTDLGRLYKGEYYLSSLIIPYNKKLLRTNGSIAKVMKFWDSFESQAHTCTQAGKSQPPTNTLILSANIIGNNYNLTFSGTPVSGYQVGVAVEFSTTGTFLYTIQAGDSIASIIAAFVALINPTVGFNAVANGSILEITGVGAGFMTGSYSQTFVGDITTVADYNYSFNELRNGFCSFYDFHPEWALSAADLIYSWKNGQIYKHDNTTAYCYFYNTQYGCDITVVFNDSLLEKKSWNSLNEVASDIWAAPVIYTNTLSYGSQRQQTSLVEAEFKKLENNHSSAIKRDAFSRGGKINGQFLKGNWICIKLEKTNATNLITLQLTSVRCTDSPLTVK